MFNTGDIVKVINPRSGCLGAKNLIGKVTKRESTNGLISFEGTINIETNTGIWRVNEDGCELFQRILTIESLICKRKEAKEMTIREIEAALGYSVKIIKEEEC